MKMEQISGKVSWAKLGALVGFITEFLLGLLNNTQIEYWLGHKTELKKNLKEAFSIDELGGVREEWTKFYKEKFNWDVDFSMVITPSNPTIHSTDKWRLIFIPKGMTIDFAFEVTNKIFKCRKGHSLNNLDNQVNRNYRNTLENYAIWICYKSESYEVGENLFEFYERRKITLLERIILESKYFSETGEHLTNNLEVDVCLGSLSSDNQPLSAGWLEDVFWTYINTGVISHYDLRYRKVVAL